MRAYRDEICSCLRIIVALQANAAAVRKIIGVIHELRLQNDYVERLLGRLMKQLAIPLGCQKTTTKWLVIVNRPYG